MEDYKNAVKYYGIMYGYSYAMEAFLIKDEILNPLEPDIGMSHWSFAEFQYLLKSKKISKDIAEQIFKIGMKKGASLYRPLKF